MARVERIRAVKRALRKECKRRTDALARGIKRAGLFLQRQSQAIVPVDTGALRSSAFTRMMPIADPIIVVVGYTQNYAIYVHEDLWARHAPGRYAKYLEWPARVYRNDMRNIVEEEMRKS